MIISFKETEYKSIHYLQALAVRYNELRKPLGLVYDTRDLEEEKNQLHFVGIIETQVVCTCSVIVVNKMAKMRQVATLKDFQGKGFGAQLCLFVENFLATKGIKQIKLHARIAVLPFYEKQNYAVASEEFMEVGIAHYKMIKEL